MTRFMKGGLLALLFFTSVAPVYAANLPLLDPSFSIVPTECTACPCGAGGALQLVQNLMNAAISLGVVAFVLVIVYAGALFMMTPTNPESRSQAKGMLSNATVGFIIVLAAWVLVDFIMKLLYSGGGQFGPWNKILVVTDSDKCIQPVAITPIQGLPSGLQTIEGAVTGVSGSSGGGGASNSGGGQPGSIQVGAGTCPAMSSGPCSIQNLTPSFGSAATTFSKICYNESRGTNIPSTVDIGTDHNPVSYGLFQINISANPVGGLPCPKAFNTPYTAKNHNVHVIDQALFQKCKAIALDPSQNIQWAAATYKSHGFSPWHGDEACAGF